MSRGGALPPAVDMAFDASAMRPIQDEEEYDPSEMRPARAPSFMYVLAAADGTAREAAEWWLSDAPHHFPEAPHTHYAWLEGYALALDGGAVYAEELRDVQDAARELGRARGAGARAGPRGRAAVRGAARLGPAPRPCGDRTGGQRGVAAKGGVRFGAGDRRGARRGRGAGRGAAARRARDAAERPQGVLLRRPDGAAARVERARGSAVCALHARAGPAVGAEARAGVALPGCWEPWPASRVGHGDERLLRPLALDARGGAAADETVDVGRVLERGARAHRAPEGKRARARGPAAPGPGDVGQVHERGAHAP
jgi:hypothetical protein